MEKTHRARSVWCRILHSVLGNSCTLPPSTPPEYENMHANTHTHARASKQKTSTSAHLVSKSVNTASRKLSHQYPGWMMTLRKPLYIVQ